MSISKNELTALLPFGTAQQNEKIKALIKHGTHRKAAAAIGVAKSNITASVAAVKKKAAIMGHSPNHDMVHIVPPGFNVKGVSTLYGEDGEVKIQWVKSQADKEKQAELLQLFTDDLGSQILGKSKLVPAPKHSNADLLTVYPQPEPHYGLFSWGKETGDDYDCNIASSILIDSMSQLVASAPESETGMISSIGDWFHTDTPDNRTAKAGNQLDVDTRWPKVVSLGVEVFVVMVELALKKHRMVIIKGVGGNHDPQTNFALAMILDAYYRNNDRVIVDLDPSPFKYHRFGQNLIGINHGDMAKPAELPLIMLADRPKDCGDTLYRLWLTGHIHHLTRKEFTGGIIVETIRSIAAKDSWHSASGYRSGRDAKAIVFHKDKGEIQRITVAI